MQDIIIKNAIVVDGNNTAPYTGGVAVKDGMITAVGDVEGLEAMDVIDAKGLVVCPGFIDPHSHSDDCFLDDNRCESKIYQGVTTEICGMCGYSDYPAQPGLYDSKKVREADGTEDEWIAESISDFIAHAKARNKTMSTNLVPFVGHGTIRSNVLAYDGREPNTEELEQMKAILEKELAAGAWGMSLGLEYTPGCFARPAELRALGSVVKKYDGLVTAHMRNEGRTLEDAMDEIFDIGRESGCRVHISHLKIDFHEKWGIAPQIWQKIEDARAEGIRVGCDMYPYLASSTGITNRCPKWAIEGGVHMATAHLKGERRQEVLDELKRRFPDRNWAERCLITETEGRCKEAEGITLAALADKWNLEYYLAAAELIIVTEGHTSCCFFVMSEDDVNYFLSKDIGICSDGYCLPLDPKLNSTMRHPRSFGAQDRFLRLARENKICSLEKAVWRLTALPADMIGIKDRGRLEIGKAADITVFNPDTIEDKADWTNPYQKPIGVECVVVNGQVAIRDGKQTEVRNGRFLLHK